MQQKPSPELVEQAEIYASVGMAIHHLCEYLEASGYLEEGTPERLRNTCYILLGLEARLGTEEVKELILDEGTQIIAVTAGPDGAPEGIINP